MLIAILVISLFSVTLSTPATDELVTFETLDGNWKVFDAHWGDSNIQFGLIGNLTITGSKYIFIPLPDAFITQEMDQRFGFILQTEGSLWFEYREGIKSTDSFQTDVILGTVNFNDGEGFLVRTDLDNGELCITSSVSEIELFHIFKPLIPEDSGNTSE